ncbi:MAG: RNA-dependent RNA polymerase [Sclerotinia sclerotiorum narnavirus 3]|nr:MAG: RNA-dependent RNA polymerase [Sclerotinia sclerotiorum narnavirus 3]
METQVKNLNLMVSFRDLGPGRVPTSLPVMEEKTANLTNKKIGKQKSKKNRITRAVNSMCSSISPSGKPVSRSSSKGASKDKQKSLDVQAKAATYVSDHSPYYRSGVDLDNGRSVPALFHIPIEVLANSSGFTWSGMTVLGTGALLNIVPPSPPCVGLSYNHILALWSEDTLKVFSRITKDDGELKMKKRIRYFRNLRVLRFMRATWDALLLGLQEVKLLASKSFTPLMMDNVSRRNIHRTRMKLVFKPFETAAFLKSQCGLARLYWLGGKRLSFLPCLSSRFAITWSYVARALPPPAEDPSLLPAFRKRLMTDPVELPKDFGSWAEAYLDRFAPKSPVRVDLFTQPSNHSALGYPRSLGGHQTGVQDLIFLGMHVLYPERSAAARDPQLATDLRSRNKGFRIVETYIRYRFDPLNPSVRKDYERTFAMEGLAEEYHGEFLEQIQVYLWAGVQYTLDNIEYVPVLPIYAEEKGLKVRYPTCTLTAANLMQQVLRRAADSYFMNDPRCAGALGGPEVNLAGLSGDWYSQDATAATDYHLHEMTILFYHKVIDRDPRLEKYRGYLDKLLGPKYLLSGDIDPVSLCSPFTPAGAGLDAIGHMASDASEAADREFSNPLATTDVFKNPVPIFGNWLRHVTVSTLPHVQIVSDEDIARASELFPVRCRPNAERVDGEITRVGEMMGDPTSFPLLFVVSLYSLDKAFTAYPPTQQELKERRYIKGLRRSDHRGALCGDDALLAQFTPERRLVYDEAFMSLGGRLQWLKSYYHKRYGLFTEIPYIDGRPQQFNPISVWSAPPGGSKGEINWYNQPVTASDRLRLTGRNPKRGLWRWSPFVYPWGLAHKMGVPVGASISEGGLALPSVSNIPGLGTPSSRTYRFGPRYRTEKWLGYLGNLKLEDVATGTGLSVLPAATVSVAVPSLAAVGKTWIKGQLASVEEENRRYNAAVAGTTKIVQTRLGPRTIVRKPKPLPYTRYDILEDGTRTVPIGDVGLRVASTNLTWDLYFRPLQDPQKTPSVRTVASKLDGAVRKAPNIHVPSLSKSYRNVHRKLEDMRATLVNPEFLPTPGVPRSYGLEVSPVKVRKGYRSTKVG